MNIKNVIGPSLAVVLAAGVAWGAQDFRIEPGWSHIEFGVKNFGVHTVDGRFKDFSGSIHYEDTDVTKSAVTVTIPIASVETGIKKRDDHLQKPEFFDAAQFPQMTFTSSRIEKKGDGYVLIGALTMKGHTKDVELPFTYSLSKSEQGVPTLRAQAQGTLNRHDFGIDYGSNFSVGSQIHIILHIQATPN